MLTKLKAGEVASFGNGRNRVYTLFFFFFERDADARDTSSPHHGNASSLHRSSNSIYLRAPLLFAHEPFPGTLIKLKKSGDGIWLPTPTALNCLISTKFDGEISEVSKISELHAKQAAGQRKAQMSVVISSRKGKAPTQQAQTHG